jgi:hypothetical protein
MNFVVSKKKTTAQKWACKNQPLIIIDFLMLKLLAQNDMVNSLLAGEKVMLATVHHFAYDFDLRMVFDFIKVFFSYHHVLIYYF